MLRRVMEKVSLCGFVAVCFLVVSTKSDDEKLVNYVIKSYLTDGEHELRLRFGDVLVHETSVTQNSSDGTRKGLLLRQIASGPHFLQLIYKINQAGSTRKHKKLVECETINDWEAANQFRTKFQKELQRAGLHLTVPENKHLNHPEETEDYFDTFSFEQEDRGDGDAIDLDQGLEEFRNVSVRMLLDNEIIPGMKKSMNLQSHKRQCKRHHRKLQQIVKSSELDSSFPEQDNKNNNRRVRREAFRVGIMPGTLWCGDGDLADKYESMGAHVGTDRCCREHDGCPFIIEAMSSNYGLFNYRMHTLSYCPCDESTRSYRIEAEIKPRPKRELGNAFRLPGTQWCGRGFSAKEITHLGGFTGTDKCCRYHDLGCPFYIEGFQEKYGLFNWRMYTINHCTCDERFRSCLKQTNTGAANFVGKIFFNVVQTKCFLLKPERACGKRSWWGKCLKHEYKKQAHLRDPIPY